MPRGGAGGDLCMVRSNVSWVMVTWGPFLPCEQTDTTENMTFAQLWWGIGRNDYVKFRNIILLLSKYTKLGPQEKRVKLSKHVNKSSALLHGCTKKVRMNVDL